MIALRTGSIGDTGAAVFYVLSFTLLGAAGVGIAALVLSTSLIVLRTSVFPRWIGAFGLVLAVAWLVAAAAIATDKEFVGLFGLISFVLWAIWILAISVVMLAARNRPSPEPLVGSGRYCPIRERSERHRRRPRRRRRRHVRRRDVPLEPRRPPVGAGARVEGEDLLLCEAVSDEFVGRHEQLAPGTLERLGELGWGESPADYTRWEAASTPDERTALADVLWRTLVEAFGQDPQSPPAVDLLDEG